MTKEELITENERLAAELEEAKQAPPPPNTAEADQLKAQLSEAQAKLKKFGVGKDVEQGVRNRMALGMDRESAITCARRQSAHDEALSKKWANDTERQEALIQAASLA